MTMDSFKRLPFVGRLFRSASDLQSSSRILATYGALFHERMAMAALEYDNSFIQPLSEGVSEQHSEWQWTTLDIEQESHDEEFRAFEECRERFRTEEEETAILEFMRSCFVPRFIPNDARALLYDLQWTLQCLNPETSVIFMAFLFMERLQVRLEELQLTNSGDGTSDDCCLHFRRWFILCTFYASKMIDDEQHDYLPEWKFLPWLDVSTAEMRAWERKGYAALGYRLHVTNSEWSSWINHLFWSSHTLPSGHRLVFHHLLAGATPYSNHLSSIKFSVPAVQQYDEIEYDEDEFEIEFDENPPIDVDSSPSSTNTSPRDHTHVFEDLPLSPKLSPSSAQYYELESENTSQPIFYFALEGGLTTCVNLPSFLFSGGLSAAKPLPYSDFSIPCYMAGCC